MKNSSRFELTIARLEQRHRRILRLLENPAVELEPRQLAVDEGVAVHALGTR
jgi:hypothetical protein